MTCRMSLPLPQAMPRTTPVPLSLRKDQALVLVLVQVQVLLLVLLVLVLVQASTLLRALIPAQPSKVLGIRWLWLATRPSTMLSAATTWLTTWLCLRPPSTCKGLDSPPIASSCRCDASSSRCCAHTVLVDWQQA